MNYSKRIQAIELRNNGKSYSEINNIVKVSKSTLSIWLRDIELTKQQKSRLKGKQSTAYSSAKKKRAESLKHHLEIQKEASKEAVKLADNSFFVAGLMLYWAEGSKYFGSVQFSNSDPVMIKLMMRWFRKFCAIPESKFRVGLFLHSLHTKENCQDFWHNITAVPLSQFQKPYIKPTIFSNRKNKLYEGTCMIKIHSRELLSKIIGWKNGVEKILNNPSYV